MWGAAFGQAWSRQEEGLHLLWVRRETREKYSGHQTNSPRPKSCWFSLHTPFLIGALGPAISLTSSPAASTVLLLSLCPVLQPRPQPATSLQHKSDHLTSTPETLQWLLIEPRVQANLLLPILLAWQRTVAPPTLTPLLSLAPHPQCHSLVAAPRGSLRFP